MAQCGELSLKLWLKWRKVILSAKKAKMASINNISERKQKEKKENCKHQWRNNINGNININNQAAYQYQ
jgi:reverse gyrase